MSSELNKLYSSVIKSHNETPFHFENRTDAQILLKASNPICGDRFELYLHSDHDVIKSIYFHGFGCAISKASTSVLAKWVEGKTKSEALALCNSFLQFIDKNLSGNPVPLPEDFKAFSGVHDFPERHDCATLSWMALKAFLDHENKT